MRDIFIEAARGVTSVQVLKSGRDYIWSDLGEIEDANIRREARERFRNTMTLAEILEERHPEDVSRVIIEGVADLIEFLEANDVGDLSGG